MQSSSAAPDLASAGQAPFGDSHTSGVSWGAIFAGAAAAAALSFILLILGVGLGLSSISPYSYHSTALSDKTIGWLVFMQLAASGIGGFMAGRLRVKWANVHNDEVHFRDTAHGLLAWAVATLLSVAMLAGGARAVLSGAIDTGAPAAAALATGAGAAASNQDTGKAANPSDYFSDMVLRSGSSDGADNGQRTEVRKILMANLAAANLNPDDRNYLAQLTAKRSGLSQEDAERRVDAIYGRAVKAAAEAKAKTMEAAEQARKAGAHSALWMFIALLFGAFIASLCATIGGEQRDHARVSLRTAL